jgi:hypothetical protein
VALLTANEVKKLPPDFRGRYKHRCDSCGRVIISSLIYGAVNGKEACTESCKNNLNKEAEKENMLFAKKKSKDADEEEVEKSEAEESSESAEESESESEKPKKGAKVKKTAKKEKEAPAKKRGRPAKKDKDEEEEEKPKKGKKAVKEDKKPKKKSKDDDDEKPKKTRESTVGTKTNPFREGSFVAEAFEMAKEGCTVKAMKKFCEKKEVDYGWTLARFKKEEKRGVEWKFTLDDSDMKIKLKK